MFESPRRHHSYPFAKACQVGAQELRFTGEVSTRDQAPPAFENTANEEPGLSLEPSRPRPMKVMAATICAVMPLAASLAVISCWALHVT